MEDFLADEVVSLVADAGVEVPVVGGVLGAGDALSADPHVSQVAEAAALVPVLVHSADWLHEGGAGLVGAVVDFPVGASSADAVDQVESEIADAGLPGLGVDFIGAAGDQDAGAVDVGKSGTAPACVELGEVGLVDGASLADVLDDLESGLALADAVDKDLIGAAGVDAVAPLGHGVVLVASRALAAHAVDGIEVALADAVTSYLIEDLVSAAAVAVQVGAGGDVWSGSAVLASFGGGCCGEQQHNEERLSHDGNV